MPLGQLDTVDCNELPARRPPASAGASGGPDTQFDKILARWLVLSEASNSINRCMGLPDLYPFVISPVTAGKLAFRPRADRRWRKPRDRPQGGWPSTLRRLDGGRLLPSGGPLSLATDIGMIPHPTAFERYRRSPNERTTLPRLVFGTALIALFWLAATAALIFGGVYAYAYLGPWLGAATLTFDQGGIVEQFLTSRIGIVVTLLTFAGIWIGVLVAMRAVHRRTALRPVRQQPPVSRSGFAKGLVAVLLTSALTEVGLYLLVPEIGRSPIAPSTWLLYLVPVVLAAFVQTSSEELLFRGYLLRGLASRFRSPLVWALLPGIAFTALHWNTGIAAGHEHRRRGLDRRLCRAAHRAGLRHRQSRRRAWARISATISTGFLLISHESSLSSFALFRSPPLDEPRLDAGQMAAIIAMSSPATLLTLLLLLHPRSPLKVEADLGDGQLPL